MVLFLEKDFQLVEPFPCLVEQLLGGAGLINNGAAQVVRFRSRDNAGRPNWAQLMFMGHEIDAIGGRPSYNKARQPNLACNVYYWLPDETLLKEPWNDVFWVCDVNQRPTFLCSLAFDCNWTNNPFLVKRDWWLSEYTNKRFKINQRINPYQDLESWMNWEPKAWNKEGWVVAQSYGLFKHVDFNNIAY
jgi:hypothetical protein